MILAYSIVGAGYEFAIGRDELNASVIIERILGPGTHRYRVLAPCGTGRDDCAMTLTLESALESALEFLRVSPIPGYILFVDDTEPGTFSLEPWRE